MPLSDSRIAFNFVFGTLILGSIAATVLVFIPFFLAASAIHGFIIPPPSPSNVALRVIQLVECYVICHVGSILAAKCIKNHITLENFQSIRRRSLLWALVIPALCLIVIAGISIPKYGLTFAVAFNGGLVFGSFTVLFFVFTARAFKHTIKPAIQQDDPVDGLTAAADL